MRSEITITIYCSFFEIVTAVARSLLLEYLNYLNKSDTKANLRHFWLKKSETQKICKIFSQKLG